MAPIPHEIDQRDELLALQARILLELNDVHARPSGCKVYRCAGEHVHGVRADLYILDEDRREDRLGRASLVRLKRSRLRSAVCRWLHHVSSSSRLSSMMVTATALLARAHRPRGVR